MLRIFKSSPKYKEMEGFDHHCELVEAGIDFLDNNRLCDTTPKNERNVYGAMEEKTWDRSGDKERLLVTHYPSQPTRCCLEISKKDIDLLHTTRRVPIEMMERHYRRRNAVFETDLIQREGLSMYVYSIVNLKYVYLV